ncbi:MAG: hypothetical protein FJ170_09215, partial [Gammaproteobacteria bacterium]|nr:hypothetical protein [Gammaproteobacteria bacterium]
MTGIAGWAMASFAQPTDLKARRYPGASGLPLAGKISLVLLVVGSLLALAVAWLGQEIVLRRFSDTESELVVRNRQILHQAFQAGVDKVDMITRDWSQWDQLYNYARDGDPGFAAEELNPEALERLGLDVLQVLDPDGRPIGVQVRPDMPGPDGKPSADFGAEIRQLVTRTGGGQPTFSGWLNTSIGPLI